jgi:putative phage-type endonuclease
MKQVKKLLSIKKVEQRTPEWYELRMKMITASDWATAIGQGKNSKIKDIILKKCGKGPKFKGNIYTAWGTKYEDVATRFYEIENKTKVYEFGVLQHPVYLFLGASPDGITPLGIMLEIKCPFSRVITGIVPHHYWVQIQGQLEVCDLDFCDFLECKITEYDSMEEYLEDTEENPPARQYTEDLEEKFKAGDILNRTKDGFHKGAIVTYNTPEGDNKYFYSELGVSQREFNRWKKSLQVPENWVMRRINFWRFTKISCVRVERDRKWFEEALPKLQETWNQVEHYKKIGCDSLLKDIPKEDMVEEASQQEITALLMNNDYDFDLKDTTTTNNMRRSKNEDMWDGSHLSAIFDLEVGSWLLPKYIPIEPVVMDERSVEEFKMNLAGTCKLVSRCRSALTKLNKCPSKLIDESEINIRNIVKVVNNWMVGLPKFLDDILEIIKFDIPKDLKESLESANVNIDKWKNGHQKWLSKWD